MHKKLLKISCWVLGSFCLLGLLGFWLLVTLPRGRVEALEQQLAAGGMHLRIEELAPPPVPEDVNAAPLYLEAYALLSSLEFEGNDIFDYRREFGREKTGEGGRVGLRRLMADPVFARAMALLDEATARQACHFDLDYGAGAMHLQLPHVSPLLNLTSLNGAHLRLQLEKGDTPEVLNCLARMNALARRLDTEPFLISKLVKIANVTLYLDSLAFALASAEPDAEMLGEVKGQLALFPAEPVKLDWMDGERIFMLETWRSGNYLQVNGYDLGDVLDEIDSVADGVMYVGGFFLPVWDEVFFYENFMEMRSIYARPYHRIDWAGEDRRFAEMPGPYFLSGELSNFRRVREKMTSAETSVTMAKVALWLYEQRLSSGVFPEGLPPDLAADPFTGSPFCYEKTEAGFRLYSPGPNQRDEGGVKDRSTGADDLLWSHPYETK